MTNEERDRCKICKKELPLECDICFKERKIVSISSNLKSSFILGSYHICNDCYIKEHLPHCGWDV
jgi:hypothetical protein